MKQCVSSDVSSSRGEAEKPQCLVSYDVSTSDSDNMSS